jgi:hypothetical protein
VVAQVGQGDEVAEEERVAVIVVLDVEGAAHARGGLQHKAERAQVVAAPNVDIKGRVLELQAKRLAIIALAAGTVRLAVTAVDQLHLVFGGIELHIDNVFDRLAVDFEQLVAGQQAELSRQGAGLDVADQAAMGFGGRLGGSHGGIVPCFG